MGHLKDFHVLVTPKSYGVADESLKTELQEQAASVVFNQHGRLYTPEELVSLITDVDAVIAGNEIFDANVINKAKRLKVISRYGVGLENIDLKAATNQGIIVTNTPGANADSVAELTLGLIINLTRRICELNRATKSGQWLYRRAFSLKDKTIGVIGYGAIGREVVLRLKPFGCRVIVNDHHRSENSAADGFEFCSKDYLISNADLISLHLPLNNATRGFVDKKFLDEMKEGAFLVNTARGELVDEAAIAASIESGKLAGYGADVFIGEKPDASNPLLKLDQAIATPHCGSHTDHALNSVGRMALDNLIKVLNGQKPDHVVNPEVFGS